MDHTKNNTEFINNITYKKNEVTSNENKTVEKKID